MSDDGSEDDILADQQAEGAALEQLAHEGDEESDEELDENPLQHLPNYVIHRVNKLRELNSKRDHIMEDYLLERVALEQKYASLVAPLFQERCQIVAGGKDEAIAQTSIEDGALGGDDDDVAGDRVKGIPQFWICAMMHNETIGELIAEDDVDCLESLYDITYEEHADGRGFKLHFYFAPNDYFENSVLTKTYDVQNLHLSDEPLLKNVKGTTIKWKPDRALTFRMIKKKQRGKGKHAGQVRTVEKKEELDSFFRWFEPPDMPPMEDIDEEEATRLEEIFDDDYEIAQAVRLQLIPQAVLWFTGEVGEEEVTLAMGGDAPEAE
jgi:nucleosome assembly protein 1-like 1